ncbi:MAG: hypothetical protein HYV07_11025, partial [Deltaproteobacteria bacterium]|nr:hypothetical protein [Deltaproteobacteria bacterium]
SSGVDTRDAAADLDAGTTDSGPADSGSSDSGSIDAGRSDFGPDDLARSDSEPADSSGPDSGARDSGPADSAPADSGRIDSGLVDSGIQDSGTVDAAPRDTGAFDSGSVDAAPLDASGAPDSGAADAGSFTSAPLTTVWVGDRFRVESTAFRVSFDRNRGGSVVELRAASSANLVHEATERRRFAGVAFADCWFSAEVPSANVTFTVLVANPVIVRVRATWSITESNPLPVEVFAGATETTVHPDGRLIRFEEVQLRSTSGSACVGTERSLFAGLVLDSAHFQSVSWNETPGFSGSVGIPRPAGSIEDVYRQDGLGSASLCASASGHVVGWTYSGIEQPTTTCAKGNRIWDPFPGSTASPLALLTDWARSCSAAAVPLTTLSPYRGRFQTYVGADTCVAARESAFAFTNPPAMSLASGSATFDPSTGGYEVASGGTSVELSVAERVPSLTIHLPNIAPPVRVSRNGGELVSQVLGAADSMGGVWVHVGDGLSASDSLLIEHSP